MTHNAMILDGMTLFTGEHICENRALVIENGFISRVIPHSDVPSGVPVERLPPDCLLAPGFIDVQVNGAGGVLFNDNPTKQAIDTIGTSLRSFGVTGFLPTFITDSKDKMDQACMAAVQACEYENNMALGIHLEGPFINSQRCGIHDPRYIRIPNRQDVIALEQLAIRLADKKVLLTLAPEIVQENSISQLIRAGVIVSIGHTAATYAETLDAIASGATGFTHLFNAMPPIMNREPGPVGAALSQRHISCGIIADGFHVHPALLRATLAAKAPGSVFLVTDAMPPVGTKEDSFILYGRHILRKDGRLISEDGVLAGADITNIQLVRNCISLLGLHLEEALRMASLYPARFLKMDHQRGYLKPGYIADMVLLSNWRHPTELKVEKTWVAGKL